AFGHINRLEVFRWRQYGAGEFGDGLRQGDQRLGGGSLNGRNVGGAKIRWQNTVLKLSIREASLGRIGGVHKRGSWSGCTIIAPMCGFSINLPNSRCQAGSEVHSLIRTRLARG